MNIHELRRGIVDASILSIIYAEELGRNPMEDTGLTDIETIACVREKYLQSFIELQKTQKPRDRHSVTAFTAAVKRVHNRGSDIARLMVRGLEELMGSYDHSDYDRSQIPHHNCEGEAELERVQDFMDKFYQNRVAMRFLCGHFLALSSPPRKGFVGLIRQGVSLSNIAQSAGMEVASICCHALGACPEIRMRLDRSGDGLVAAVPEYVHYVLLELLKNAMMATMKTHGCGDAQAATAKRWSRHRGGKNKNHAPIVFADVPEVTISVHTVGDDDVFLIVSDQGGVFLKGMSVSRIYARCFGGELKLQSKESRGTHATFRLSRRGTKLEPVVWSKSANGADTPDNRVQLRQEPPVRTYDKA